MQLRLLNVAVDGGDLRVLLWGTGKRVAVAVHGITASGMSWQAVARHMPSDWTLAAPDLRGRGHSRDLPGPYGLDRHASDVAAVLRHFGGRPVLAGHSMGAYIALLARDAYPELVRRLVLVDGGLPLPVPEGIDLDATLIGSHSEKEGAAGNFKGGYGFHPILAYGDETSEALAGELRSGNAGANTAIDQIVVAEQAVEQIPGAHIENIKLLLRVDTAGASHELLDWAREGRIEFSVGYELNETVRGAILEIADGDWIPALDQDGSPRANGQVADITGRLDLSTWPAGSRVIVRRERAHPGAQLSFTDYDGHRFQAILTDQAGDIAHVERDHRGRARVEDHIRNDKDTGLRNLPFRDFQHNRVWLELVRIAHDLLVWTQRLLLTGQLAKAEPKRLRYRILHVAARLCFHARTATLRIQASWPWAHDLTIAFARLRALPAPPG